MLKRNDRSWDNFSYVDCKDCLGRDKIAVINSRIAKRRLGAYRDAVAEQIHKYKDTHSPECTVCGFVVGIEQPHVDHYDPEFVELVMAFEHQTSLPLPMHFQDKEQLSYMAPVKEFLQKDDEFKRLWVVYHTQNARLRILCPPCNRKRTRKKYIPKEEARL
jgi:hypothetical protein